MTDDEQEYSSATGGTIVRNLTDSYCEVVNTPKPSSIAMNTTTPHTGLSDSRALNNEGDLATIVASLVGERFSLTINKVSELTVQLEIYFKYCSILDEEILSIMTDYSSWPVVHYLPRADELTLITVPVTMCLSKIARYTELAIGHGLFMTKKVTYNELVAWYGATKAHTTLMKTLATTNATQDSKVPNFKVPEFTGETL
jgi:hypothetical protein